MRIIGKLIWWCVLKPILLIVLLFAFLTYKISRGVMTMILAVFYPGQNFGDYGYNDAEDV